MTNEFFRIARKTSLWQSRLSFSLDLKSVLVFFWQIARQQKKSFIAIILTLLCISGLEAAIPFFYEAFANGFASDFSPENQDSLLHAFGYMILAYCFLWAGWRVFEFLLVHFNVIGMRSLERLSYEIIQSKSVIFFQKSFSGSLVRKAGKFIRAFDAIVDWTFFWLIHNGLSVLIALTLFTWKDALFGLLFFVWVLFFLGGNILFARWKLKYDEQTARADSHLGAVYSDAFSNILSIKSFARENQEQDRIDIASQDIFVKRRWTWNLTMFSFAVQGAFMIVAELLLVWLMIQRWEAGIFSVGEFVFFQSIFLPLFHRLWDFGRSLRNLFTALADAQEMMEIIDMPSEERIQEVKNLSLSQGKITFSHVSFGYEGEKKQFSDFSLCIPAGQKVALVGESGAGKSTLVKLLFRFFEIQKGKIFFDEQDISKYSLSSLRSQISLVPQQPELFHRNISENISCGKKSATCKEISEAAKKAEALDFITSFPQKFETLVGERGVKLSGGEKQRIAIARALLEDAPIVLLDEATSALDSLTEQKIQKAIGALLEKKTAIVIAHRLSTILKMDRILVLDKGEIIEDGTHEELLVQKGKYAKMWSHQAGGFLQEEE